MANFLERIASMFHPNFNPPIGNDLPSQGGITGNMPYGDQDPNSVGVPQLPNTAPFPNLPAGGYPPDSSTGSVMGNQAMDPTQNPYSQDMGDIGGPTSNSPSMTDITNNPYGDPYGGGSETQFTGMGNQYNPYASGDDEAEVMRLMNQIYSPEHTAYDRFNQMISQYPQRNHPGVWRRIGATLGGIGGGVPAADAILYAPFNAQLRDWKEKIGPVQQAANLERYGNANERMMANQAARNTVAGKRNQIIEQNYLAQQKQREGELENRKARTAIYKYKTMHPNGTFDVDEDGNMVLKTQDGQVRLLRNEDGEPLKASKLPEDLRMEIGHNYKMEEIGARSDASSQTATDRAWQLGEYQGKPVWYNPISKEIQPVGEVAGGPPKGPVHKAGTTPSGSGKGANLTPQQIAQKKLNIAREILNTEPQSKNWIKFNGAQVLIDKDGEYDSQDDQTKAYIRSLRDRIEGKQEERISVIEKATGIKGSLPKSQAAAAIKSGKYIMPTPKGGNIELPQGEDWEFK